MDMARVQAINEEINGNKQLLSQSDYQCLKFSEGEMSEEEYAPIRAAPSAAMTNVEASREYGSGRVSGGEEAMAEISNSIITTGVAGCAATAAWAVAVTKKYGQGGEGANL